MGIHHWVLIVYCCVLLGSLLKLFHRASLFEMDVKTEVYKFAISFLFVLINICFLKFGASARWFSIHLVRTAASEFC